MSDIITYYELRSPERRDNLAVDLRDVKRLFPSEILTTIPEIGILTIDDFFEWIPSRTSYSIDKIKSDMRLWIELRYWSRSVMCIWNSRKRLLLYTVSRLVGSDIISSLTTLGVTNIEELLFKYYKWCETVVFPPRTNRWQKMKQFVEERRELFT